MGKATRWFKGLFGIKNSNSGDKKVSDSSHKKDITGLCYNPTTIPPNLSAAEAAWLRSYNAEANNEQNMHAIAVAAATAAAADAAVAAAQAAVEVVRLTSHGRCSRFGGGQGNWAAVKIQTVFRGYLARKALRALKGLVKIQALVRGYFVRKQAAATLHSMQALIRAQAAVRSRRNRSLNDTHTHCHSHIINNRPRNSTEKFDETRSEHCVSIHSRRLSSSFDTNPNINEENPKIVEIDTVTRPKPKSRSRRTNNSSSVSDFTDDPFYQTISSPLPTRVPARVSTPDPRQFQNPDSDELLLTPEEEYKFSSTAQSTPRFAKSSIPLTPSRSLCGDYGYNYEFDYPNFMAKTQSFKAKLRSYSAPKQRPEPKQRRGGVSLSQMLEGRSSVSGFRMQRSCSKAQEVVSFKNAVMGKIHGSRDFDRDRNW